MATIDIKELGGRLAEVLAPDKNILLRRAEFSGELTALKTKYPADARYITYIERAIDATGLGEEFLREDREPSGDRGAFVARMKKLLTESDMQERQADIVVEILADALGWNATTEPDAQPLAAAAPAQAPTVIVPEGALWTCGGCGTKNTGRYCIICGASSAEAVAVEEPPVAATVSERTAEMAAEPVTAPEEALAPQPEANSVVKSRGYLKFALIAVVLLVMVTYFKSGDESTKESQKPARVTSTAPKAKDSAQEEPTKKKTFVEDASPKQPEEKSPLKSELGLGALELNQTVEYMHDILGAENSKEYKNNRTWYYYADVNVVVKGDRISALESNSPSLKTKRGLHEGSTLDDVKELYGTDYMVTDYNGMLLLEYDYPTLSKQRGILRFAIEKSNGRVKYISIRIPE